jgi:hypothetical protein
MHAAVIALRGAGVPRALTAALVQQVRRIGASLKEECCLCSLFSAAGITWQCASLSNFSLNSMCLLWFCMVLLCYRSWSEAVVALQQHWCSG